MSSEFRQDLVSGEWVLMAANRSKRPHDFVREPVSSAYISKENCPFENLELSGNELIWRYPDDENWSVALIKNKFPAVDSGVCTPIQKVGPFNTHVGVGNHEIFVFRDHDKSISDLENDGLTNIIRCYKKRTKEIIDLGGCTQYLMIFHNFGKEAGASLYHPHSQLLSAPIIPPDVSRSLYGAQRFYKDNHRRVYDGMISWEIEQKKRIVYENDFFIAFCPFASRSPYEVRIFCKDSHAHFEKMPDPLDLYLGDALGVVLKKIKKALNNPAFNFYIHTAPLENVLREAHDFYTWHIEILPTISIVAGIEMATGITINIVDPDEAA